MAVSKDVKHLLIWIAAIWFGTLLIAGNGYGIYAKVHRDHELAEEKARKFAETSAQAAKMKAMYSR